MSRMLNIFGNDDRLPGVSKFEKEMKKIEKNRLAVGNKSKLIRFETSRGYKVELNYDDLLTIIAICKKHMSDILIRKYFSDNCVKNKTEDCFLQVLASVGYERILKPLFDDILHIFLTYMRKNIAQMFRTSDGYDRLMYDYINCVPYNSKKKIGVISNNITVYEFLFGILIGDSNRNSNGNPNGNKLEPFNTYLLFIVQKSIQYKNTRCKIRVPNNVNTNLLPHINKYINRNYNSNYNSSYNGNNNSNNNSNSNSNK